MQKASWRVEYSDKLNQAAMKNVILLSTRCVVAMVVKFLFLLRFKIGNSYPKRRKLSVDNRAQISNFCVFAFSSVFVWRRC